MPNAECRTHARRRGFSFTEILFAVMILGIGFIMVAAMFPVAIHQTEANNQETIAAAVARSSSNFLNGLAAMPLPPASITGMTTNGSTQTPSILLPTFQNATLPAANTYMLPTSPSYSPQSSIVVPGQVWSLCDVRDAWVYGWTNMPAPPITSHPALLWQSMAKNLIQPSDMRFGWVVLYRRDMVVRGTAGGAGTSIAPATFAQVIMIGVQCRNTQFYNPVSPPTPTSPPNDIPNPPTNPTGLPNSAANTRPTPFVPALIGTLNLTGPGTGTGVVVSPPSFVGGPSYINFGATPPAMAAEGAYVVICDDNLSSSALYTAPGAGGNPGTYMYMHGALNGRIFRLGPQGAPWPLLPGSDVTPSDSATLANMAGAAPPPTGGSVQFNVLIVGRAPTPGGGFAGPAQDVTAYTTFVPIAN